MATIGAIEKIWVTISYDYLKNTQDSWHSFSTNKEVLFWVRNFCQSPSNSPRTKMTLKFHVKFDTKLHKKQNRTKTIPYFQISQPFYFF